jgi:hypothetical protein
MLVQRSRKPGLVTASTAAAGWPPYNWRPFNKNNNMSCCSWAARSPASPAPAWRLPRPTLPMSRQRARRYGQLGACGPVIGGVLGAYWVRAPLLAAAMNAVNPLLTLFLVRELHTARNGDSAGKRELEALGRTSRADVLVLRWGHRRAGVAGAIVGQRRLASAGQAAGRADQHRQPRQRNRPGRDQHNLLHN